MGYNINFREVIYALSQALDYVGIDDIHHGKRVAFMASECAKEANWPEEDIDFLFFAGMLHDCGVSNTDVHTKLVTQIDWDGSDVHCNRGYNLLKSVNLFKDFSTCVKYHHTHWDKLKNVKNISKKEKMFANLIYLVDRVDAIRAQHLLKGTINNFNDIQDVIKKYKGTFFNEELVELFLKASSKSSFWYYLESDSLESYLHEWIQKTQPIKMNYENLKEISIMFAHIVDAKSKFTAEHSLNVSKLAKYLAEEMKLSKKSVQNIELASLLHDLGKLRVDDYILDKNGKLSNEEILIMNKHGFDTDMILRKIDGFKEISKLASMHHETLDGKGYPNKLTADKIPIEARVVSVADIFQALIQARPYRESLDANQAINIILNMQEQGKLDKNIVEILQNNLEKAYKIASEK